MHVFASFLRHKKCKKNEIDYVKSEKKSFTTSKCNQNVTKSMIKYNRNTNRVYFGRYGENGPPQSGGKREKVNVSIGPLPIRRPESFGDEIRRRQT